MPIYMYLCQYYIIHDVAEEAENTLHPCLFFRAAVVDMGYTYPSVPMLFYLRNKTTMMFYTYIPQIDKF